METVDERALKVIADWNSREYKSEGQKAASLQVLIISALKVQDKITRHACIDAFIGSSKSGAVQEMINAKTL